MEKKVVFVAGNPDLYPLEYYDAEEGAYAGVIPRLLARFSQESQYEVRYFQPGGEDRREDLADNLQVDLISGCTARERFSHTSGEAITLLETMEDGSAVAYQMWFTEVAPEAFQMELRQFLAGVSDQERVGLLLRTEREDSGVGTMRISGGVLGASIVAAVLLAALAALLLRYRKRVKEERRREETDELTGVGTRAFLERNYRALVTEQTRCLYMAICFYTDTNKMERLCGLEDTRQFLRHTAVILNEYVDQRDLLIRSEGAGFVILKATGLEAVQEWIPIAASRIRDFSKLYDKPYQCEVNCGIYPLSSDDKDLDEILFRTAQSARMARRDGMDYVLCSQDVIRRLNQERHLQEEIASGFERNEFQIYVQFYVNAKTHRIVGGEALARWQHPTRGFLTPGHFIPLMERENLIGRMDYYILERSCDFLEHLGGLGVRDFFISCNFSRKSFGDPRFVERCGEILTRYTFDRELLIFEMTESAQSRDAGVLLRNARLVKKNLGVKVALDDFGVGFTSFGDIQEYPVDGIKLDKDLVDHILTPKGRGIVTVMIKIGHELGMTILAEGVENDEQLRALQELNCDVIQGFRFYRPIPTWEASEKILEDRMEGKDLPADGTSP